MAKTADFITPIFLLALIFIEIVLIAFFNWISLSNLKKNRDIQLTGTDTTCTYSSLPELKSNDLCTSSNDYFHTTLDGIIYKLSSTITPYQQICRSFCSGGVQKDGSCASQNSNYTGCISDLENTTGCKESSKPLAEKDGVKYYASGIGC